MRVKNAKREMVVQDKISGKKFLITEVDLYPGNESATAEEIPAKDAPEDFTPEVITITPDTEYTYHVARWVKDEEIYPAVVKNGVLQVKEEPVVMGDIKAHALIGAIKGKILFTANESEGKVDLYVYEPARDRFELITGGVKADCVPLSDSEDYILIGESTLVLEDKKDDQGNITTIVKERGSRIYFYAADGSAVLPVSEEALNFSGLVRAAEENGDVYYIPVELFGKEELKEGLQYMMIRVKNGMYERLTFIDTPGEIEKSAATYWGNARIVRGADWIKVLSRDVSLTLRGPEAEDLISTGSLYLVDSYVDRSDSRKTVYVFANSARQVRKLTVTETRDRGNVYTLS